MSTPLFLPREKKGMGEGASEISPILSEAEVEERRRRGGISFYLSWRRENG